MTSQNTKIILINELDELERSLLEQLGAGHRRVDVSRRVLLRPSPLSTAAGRSLSPRAWCSASETVHAALKGSD